MIYSAFRNWCEKWLRIPGEPEPPPGDEETTRVFRASPNYLRYLKLIWMIGLVIGAIPMLVVFGVMGTISYQAASHHDGSAGMIRGVAIGVVLVILLLAAVRALFKLAMIQLNYEKRWYLVTDRSLRIREGISTVREITFTFANIQNLSVTQGPIQRWLKIADLKVETAGGGGGPRTQDGRQIGPNLHIAYFRGIENAAEIREMIAERMRGHKDAGLGDFDDPHHHENHPALPPVLPGSTLPMAAATTTTDVEGALRAMLEEARRLRRVAEAEAA